MGFESLYKQTVTVFNRVVAVVNAQSNEYAVSQSNTEEPESGWSFTMPVVEEGYYLWTRSTLVYNTGYDKTVCHVGNAVNQVGEKTVLWYATVIPNVHLIIDRAIIISTYGEQAQDNAKLHIQYSQFGDDAIVAGKTYMMPKVFKSSGDPFANITFAFGDDFDFIKSGEYGVGPFNDDDYKGGFFNYMNKTYDEVFAITNVSKFNLIPHFEITAK